MGENRVGVIKNSTEMVPHVMVLQLTDIRDVDYFVMLDLPRVVDARVQMEISLIVKNITFLLKNLIVIDTDISAFLITHFFVLLDVVVNTVKHVTDDVELVEEDDQPYVKNEKVTQIETRLARYYVVDLDNIIHLVQVFVRILVAINSVLEEINLIRDHSLKGNVSVSAIVLHCATKKDQMDLVYYGVLVT